MKIEYADIIYGAARDAALFAQSHGIIPSAGGSLTAGGSFREAIRNVRDGGAGRQPGVAVAGTTAARPSAQSRA